MRYLQVLAIPAALALAAGSMRAERKYVIGTQIDFVTGGANRAPVGGSANLLQTDFSYCYAVYPSISLSTSGSNSSFRLNYSYGTYRVATESEIDSDTHAI